MRVFLRRSVLLLLSACLLPVWAEELRGRWSATEGRRTLRGAWVARPDAKSEWISGSWTLRNDSGATVARGTWAALKEQKAWRGSWQAHLPDGRSVSGTWTADVHASTASELAEMLELALAEMVSGTWQTGGLSGSWSIRTDRRIDR